MFPALGGPGGTRQTLPRAAFVACTLSRRRRPTAGSSRFSDHPFDDDPHGFGGDVADRVLAHEFGADRPCRGDWIGAREKTCGERDAPRERAPVAILMSCGSNHLALPSLGLGSAENRWNWARRFPRRARRFSQVSCRPPSDGETRPSNSKITRGRPAPSNLLCQRGLSASRRVMPRRRSLSSIILTLPVLPSRLRVSTDTLRRDAPSGSDTISSSHFS